MNRVGLYVELQAKAGKGDEVAAFLAGARALVAQEPETLAWFAFRFDADRFGIFDCFADDTGRDAHLNGQVAAALMAHADELLEVPPAIRNLDILADMILATA